VSPFRRILCVYAAVMGLAVLIGCGDQEPKDTEPNPRPVTVLELREMDPVEPLQLTGSVNAWKEQDLAFEVAGRIEWIVEPGTELEGR